MKRDT